MLLSTLPTFISFLYKYASMYAIRNTQSSYHEHPLDFNDSTENLVHHYRIMSP